MASAQMLIAEALQIHDDDPVKAGQLLMDIVFNELDSGGQTHFIWLANHVNGELLSQWATAFELLASNRCENSVFYFKSLVVAAYCSGQILEALAGELELVRLTGAPLAEVKMLTGLLCVQHRHNDIEVRSLLQILACYTAWSEVPSHPLIAKSTAAALNNLLSALIEGLRIEVTDAVHQAALVDAARACEQLWKRHGTWVNHERSLYLRALVFNKFCQWSSASEVVGDALNIIDANGQEPVDRAFLLVELARAQQYLGNEKHAGDARSEAEQLASDFDPATRDWFASVSARP